MYLLNGSILKIGNDRAKHIIITLWHREIVLKETIGSEEEGLILVVQRIVTFSTKIP